MENNYWHVFSVVTVAGNCKHGSPKTGSQWDLSTGHAFECVDTTHAANRLAPEREFVRALMSIGKRLTNQPTKDAKTHRFDIINVLCLMLF